MANAIRSRTIQKGQDPRQFALVAQGGAGPLHAAEVALSLGIPEVVVPRYPGITSAMGLLTTDLKHDLIQNEFTLSTDPHLDKLNADLQALEDQVKDQLRRMDSAKTRWRCSGLLIVAMSARVTNCGHWYPVANWMKRLYKVCGSNSMTCIRRNMAMPSQKIL
jgi:N-methylhydantoinase A/oxoprolinase/acetone carboxylase beta subunit